MISHIGTPPAPLMSMIFGNVSKELQLMANFMTAQVTNPPTYYKSSLVVTMLIIGLCFQRHKFSRPVPSILSSYIYQCCIELSQSLISSSRPNPLLLCHCVFKDHRYLPIKTCSDPHLDLSYITGRENDFY